MADHRGSEGGERLMLALVAGSVVATFALMGALLVILVMVLRHMGWL